ncbi:MAG: metallophosphoesterase [Polyangiaceae bacterium]|nr:metallophosphoesterase [Polyangiaceae bacterium]
MKPRQRRVGRGARGAALVVLGLGAAALGAGGCSKDESACEGAACGVGTGGGGGAGLDCPASGVLHGPWALRFDATSAVVRWDACRPSSAGLVVTPEEGSGGSLSFDGVQTPSEVLTSYTVIASVPPDLPGTYYLTEVAVTGLEPSRCYHYALDADATRTGRFCTARPSGASYDFYAVGDTNPALGNTDTLYAETLTPAPDFALHLGDIQYYASVFESYTVWFPLIQPLLSAGAFMPVVGNHELELPHEYEDYYERLWGGAGFDGALDHFRFQSGGVWFVGVNSEQEFGAGSPQGAWLEAQLADAFAQVGHRLTVVYFHRPLMTIADVSQNVTTRDFVRPLFAQYGVKLVLAGHVHGYERFVDGDLTYVTSGGGGAALHDLDVHLADRPMEAALRQAAVKDFHALRLHVGASSLDVEAVGNSGTVLDTFSIALP